MKFKQLLFSVFAVSLMSFTSTSDGTSSEGLSSGTSSEACCDSASWRFTCWLDGVKWDRHIYKKHGTSSQN